MSASKVYLISGAKEPWNRFQHGAANSQARRHSSSDVCLVVFAGARDPTQATELKALADKSSGRLRIVRLTSASVEDNAAAVNEVEQKAGHIDVLIANAGIARMSGNIATAPLEDFLDQYNVNSLGPIVLYRAAYDLLKKAKAPQFFVISSAAGNITNMYGAMPNGPYGSSKAAVNFLVKKISFEEEFLTAVALHPGMVASEMGTVSMNKMGVSPEQMTSKFGVPVLTPEESAVALIKLFDEITREKHNGGFLSYDGSELQW